MITLFHDLLLEQLHIIHTGDSKAAAFVQTEHDHAVLLLIGKARQRIKHPLRRILLAALYLYSLKFNLGILNSCNLFFQFQLIHFNSHFLYFKSYHKKLNSSRLNFNFQT